VVPVHSDTAVVARRKDTAVVARRKDTAVVARRKDTAVLERLSVDLDGGYGNFVRAHADAVYSAALRLAACRADAEDIAQETFVHAYRALRRFDPERVRSLQARPWLLAITLNLWRNALRSATRRPVSDALDRSAHVPDTAPGPEARAEGSEQARYLTALLRALPEHHRVPVVLHHVAGLSHAEIATVLECPVGTAKANVARGISRLRDLARQAPPEGPNHVPNQEEAP
jgi:RNA polymerase sigma-70 factor (ECF subfamily)